MIRLKAYLFCRQAVSGLEIFAKSFISSDAAGCVRGYRIRPGPIRSLRVLTLTEVVASDIRRPPVYQGTQGIDRPDGLRGAIFIQLLWFGCKNSPSENSEAKLKAKLRVEAIATRREASARYGAAAAQALSERGVELAASLRSDFRATVGRLLPYPRRNRPRAIAPCAS